MTETVVGILGLLCIVAIVVTLFQSRTLPSIAFIVFPFILAMVLVLGGYIPLDGVEAMIKTGFSSTAPTARSVCLLGAIFRHYDRRRDV